jgi:hypothetical protein
MVDPVEEEADEGNRRREEQRRRKVAKHSPDAASDPAGEDPFRQDNLKIPRPGGAVGQDGQQVQGIPEARLALA